MCSCFKIDDRYDEMWRLPDGLNPPHFESKVKSALQHSQHNMHQHFISIHAAPGDETGRAIFIRLPFYHGRKEQPSVDEVYATLSGFGCVIAHIEQYDAQGGFWVTLGDTIECAWNAAMGITQCLHGRANLQGELYHQDMIPIPEDACGGLFGHRGENLRNIKAESGADVEVTPWCGKSATRNVVFHGTFNEVEHAKDLVLDAIEETEASSAAPANFALPAPRPSCDITVTKNDLHAESLEEFPALNGSPNQPESYVPPAPVQPAVALRPVLMPCVSEPSTVEPTTLQVVPSINTKVALRRVTSTLIRKANWCLLKDRISVMNDLRTAVGHFWETKAQMERAESKGIKFGVRSKPRLDIRSTTKAGAGGFALPRTASCPDCTYDVVYFAGRAALSTCRSLSSGTCIGLSSRWLCPSTGSIQ